MSLNATPSGERVHIAFFGRRNAGKSSVVNAVTGQNLAIVSEVKGTTTDPVYKAMELLPMGPVMVIDTPGIDDEGALGELRVCKTRQVLNKADVAVLVVDGAEGLREADEELLALFRAKHLPYVLAWNKSDLLQQVPESTGHAIWVSAQSGAGIHALKEKIAHLAVHEECERSLCGDLFHTGETGVLVVPIDSAAPKGRLILPQQQAIRDMLEHGAIPVVTRETELPTALATLRTPPRLVITDSQAFERVSRDTPDSVLLTSFSILMARMKGDLPQQVAGAAVLDRLHDGDRVLISEGCTHHRQCDDIGTVKLPRWLREHTGAQLDYHWTSGTEFPEDVSAYRLVIHCGACMLNPREIRYRLQCCADQGVPVTNYGVAIAHMKGVLRRSLAPFPEVSALLHE